MRGRVITADDPSADQARTVFYGGIDKRPFAIIRVSDVEDVRSMAKIEIDPVARSAWVETGATAIQVTEAAAAIFAAAPLT